MRIVLTVAGSTSPEGVGVRATLHDNAAARAFYALLPLTLELEDYAGTELVSDLPTALPTEDAPAGMDPSVGDLTYYAPWGNLAIFYRDFRYAAGLVPLGRIEGPIEALGAPGEPGASGAPGAITVTIAKAPLDEDRIDEEGIDKAP